MKNRIKELRKESGLTQEALSELLDTTKGMVSLLESGGRRLNSDWLEKLVKIFNISLSEIWEIQSKNNHKQSQINQDIFIKSLNIVEGYIKKNKEEIEGKYKYNIIFAIYDQEIDKINNDKEKYEFDESRIIESIGGCQIDCVSSN